MKRIPIIDLLSLVLILVIGADLIHVNRRLHQFEVDRVGDDLDGARFLPMPARTLARQPVTIAPGARRLVFYMSPGCGACTKNMSSWAQAAQTIGREHVLFLVVDDRWAADVSSYLAKYNLAGVPVALADRDFTDTLSIRQLPRTVLVGRDGKVEQVWRGTIAAPAVIAAWNSSQN